VWSEPVGTNQEAGHKRENGGQAAIEENWQETRRRGSARGKEGRRRSNTEEDGDLKVVATIGKEPV